MKNKLHENDIENLNFALKLKHCIRMCNIENNTVNSTVLMKKNK